MKGKLNRKVRTQSQGSKVKRGQDCPAAFEKAKQMKICGAKPEDLKPNGHGNRATPKKRKQDL